MTGGSVSASIERVHVARTAIKRLGIGLGCRRELRHALLALANDVRDLVVEREREALAQEQVERECCEGVHACSDGAAAGRLLCKGADGNRVAPITRAGTKLLRSDVQGMCVWRVRTCAIRDVTRTSADVDAHETTCE